MSLRLPREPRGWLGLLIAAGLGTTFVDLLLLAHYEEWQQRIPLALLPLGAIAFAWVARRTSRRALRAMRLMMAVLILTGAAGVVLHLRGSLEFQTEMDPDLSFPRRLARAARAQAPPALAPLALAQLGLVGLLYCYRPPPAVPSGERRQQEGES